MAALAAAALLPALAAVSCGDVIAEVAEPWQDPATGSSPPAFISKCFNNVFACGDLLDNDSDGLIDWQDPDCLGPCDDGEDTLFPGQLSSNCALDCFWDYDNGTGNDSCHRDLRCDLLSPGPPECSYSPSLAEECQDAEPPSQQCERFCLPLTPNGCDCFGCCTPEGGSPVWLGSTAADGKTGTCDSGSLNDDKLCKPCTPVTSCENSCEHCELCFGKTALPADCGGIVMCQAEEEPCGLSFLPPCPDGTSCITGCCKPEPK